MERSRYTSKNGLVLHSGSKEEAEGDHIAGEQDGKSTSVCGCKSRETRDFDPHSALLLISHIRASNCGGTVWKV